MRTFLSFIALGLFALASTTYAHESGGKAKYHCEVKKDGKTVDDPTIKDRKACKAKGGKWEKDHDHDHGDGHDHSHD